MACYDLQCTGQLLYLYCTCYNFLLSFLLNVFLVHTLFDYVVWFLPYGKTKWESDRVVHLVLRNSKCREYDESSASEIIVP